ncbi:MAG: YCF48-related protein [Candidatus Eremiobacterota bacterium]
MKSLQWISLVSGICILACLIITGCGGGSGTTSVNLPGVTPTSPPATDTPSITPTSPTPSGTVTPYPTQNQTPQSQQKGDVVGYVVAKVNNGTADVNGLTMVQIDTAPSIANYAPVKSAQVTLASDQSVNATSDSTGRFVLHNVPYSQVNQITEVITTGDTSNIQASSDFVPGQYTVISNPTEPPVGIVSARVSPDSASITKGGARQFKVYCINSSNELVNPDSFSWSVEGGIGTIDSHGIFQASSTSARGSVKVKVGSQEATVPVEIVESTENGAITGVVTYSDGSPATGVKVSVQGLSTFSIPDSSGVYTINDVPVGEKTVSVTYDGSEKWSGTSTVTAGKTSTLNIPLNFHPNPVGITSLNPTTGRIGTAVTINGQNFGTGSGSVTFNGVTATVTSWGDIQIKVLVPSGATTGNIVVKVGNQTSSGLNYTVIPSWTAQTTGTTQGIMDIYFVDANTGWAVGDNNTILHTTNGGTTWSPQTWSGFTSFTNVHFANLNKGWALGVRVDEVVYTTDGGTTWNYQTTPSTGKYYSDMYFVDANNGWIVGTGGVILHTTNGGNNWNTQSSGITDGLSGVYFYDLNNGWAVGGNGSVSDQGKVLHTTNGGNTWTLQNSVSDPDLRAVYFVDLNNGWAVSSWSIYHTTNGGTTWNSQLSGGSYGFTDIKFIDQNIGWATASGKIMYTIDGGNVWTLQANAGGEHFCFINVNTGWLAGGAGIYKY